MWYDCGGEGPGPDDKPMACPEDLEHGSMPCGLPREGCCDTQGNAWWCEVGGATTKVICDLEAEEPGTGTSTGTGTGSGTGGSGTGGSGTGGSGTGGSATSGSGTGGSGTGGSATSG